MHIWICFWNRASKDPNTPPNICICHKFWTCSQVTWRPHSHHYSLDHPWRATVPKQTCEWDLETKWGPWRWFYRVFWRLCKGDSEKEVFQCGTNQNSKRWEKFLFESTGKQGGYCMADPGSNKVSNGSSEDTRLPFKERRLVGLSLVPLLWNDQKKPELTLSF